LLDIALGAIAVYCPQDEEVIQTKKCKKTYKLSRFKSLTLKAFGRFLLKTFAFVLIFDLSVKHEFLLPVGQTI